MVRPVLLFAFATLSGFADSPPPVVLGVAPATLTIGSSQTFLVRGTGFVDGSVVKSAGVALPSTYVSSNEISVTGDVSPAPGGLTVITVSNPGTPAVTSNGLPVRVSPAAQKVSYLAAGRFLDQAAFGPDPSSLAEVQVAGIDAWIADQLTRSSSTYTDNGYGQLDYNQSEFFINAVTGKDQLRQRVAYAFSQIFVISGLKTPDSSQFAPFLNLLAKNAFGSFRSLIREVTLNPAMGVYLDMVNNDKADPTAGTDPNENYARELLQLFTIGTVPLAADGSPLDGVTYNQDTITNLARAFTGWTYYSDQGTSGADHNSPNFKKPMIAIEANHDTGPKTIFGVNLPGGRTAVQDLDAALDVIVAQPNVGPFISFRLIQQLVTSNPSPGYVARVTAKFNDNGQKQRGDLSAVIRAILTDPEARAGDDPTAAQPSTFGHLREPVLFLVNLLRALGATVVVQNPLESAGNDMGQKLFFSPSVFNFYSPLYRVPSGLYGPEFQLLSPATTLARDNVLYSLIVDGLDHDVTFNTDMFAQLSGNPYTLVSVLDNALLYGRLPWPMRDRIVGAINATSDPQQRLTTAIYLIASSPLYQVAH